MTICWGGDLGCGPFWTRRGLLIFRRAIIGPLRDCCRSLYRLWLYHTIFRHYEWASVVGVTLDHSLVGRDAVLSGGYQQFNVDDLSAVDHLLLARRGCSGCAEVWRLDVQRVDRAYPHRLWSSLPSLARGSRGIARVQITL